MAGGCPPCTPGRFPYQFIGEYAAKHNMGGSTNTIVSGATRWVNYVSPTLDPRGGWDGNGECNQNMATQAFANKTSNIFEISVNGYLRVGSAWPSGTGYKYDIENASVIPSSLGYAAPPYAPTDVNPW
ncbi:MAG: hypothetical protein JXA71_00935 [Chitinispirillaceae bacterium]|nr:hypothetical protein [Chitinispirillaceae bacterium]